MRVRAAAFWLLGAFQMVGCRSILDIHDHELEDEPTAPPLGSSASAAPDATLPDSASSTAGDDATENEATVEDEPPPDESEPAQGEDASDSGMGMTDADADADSSDPPDCASGSIVPSDPACAAGAAGLGSLSPQ